MSLLVNPYRLGKVIGPPSLFGVSANPADGGSLTGTQVAITPPPAMQVGDLVVVSCMARTLSLSFTVFTDGGQTWNTSSAGYGASGKTMALFWCTFNGTWTANPVFECLTNANQITGIMSVYRPDIPSRVWAVDVAMVQQSIGAPTGPPYQVTRNGITTTKPGTVVYNAFHTASGTVTYANMSGAGWIDFPSPQYRNGIGSQSHAYQLNEAGGGVVIPAITKEISASIATQGMIASWFAS
jgi:hypothetical protein